MLLSSQLFRFALPMIAQPPPLARNNSSSGLPHNPEADPCESSYH